MIINRKQWLLAGASALAMALGGVSVASAQSSLVIDGSIVTATGAEINATAIQLNDAVDASSGVATTVGTTTDFIAAILSSTSTATGVDGNTVSATTELNATPSGGRLLDLDRVNAVSANAMLALAQQNSTGTATAQVGNQQTPISTLFRITATDPTGSPTSISANTVAAAVVSNDALQIATGSPTAPVATSGSLVDYGVTSTGVLAVTAPVQVTSSQINVDVNLGFAEATPTSAVYNTVAEILYSGATGPVGGNAQVSTNTVSAGLIGNRAANSVVLEGGSSTYGNGIAVTSVQVNSYSNSTTLASVVDGTTLRVDSEDGGNVAPFTGSVTMLGNTVASSTSGNVSTNSFSNSMLTGLPGQALSATPPTPPNVTAGGATATDLSVTADIAVANGQSNEGLGLSSITSNTTLSVSANVTGVAAIETNTVSATSTLNSTTNSISAIRGDQLVAAIGSNQVNATSSAAFARVTDTVLSITGDGTNATLMLNSNRLEAAASGNVATNTVSNSGLSYGQVNATATGSYDSGQTPSFQAQADYGIAARQTNDTATVDAQVLNAAFSVTGNNTSGVNQIAGNGILAAATGNAMTNRLAITGPSGVTVGEMALQTNSNTTIASLVQNATFNVAPGGGSFSSGLVAISGNSVVARSMGNTLTTTVGR